ncbi:uncharacterized protein LOC107610936 [Arachis ipaensis]|uniref:uncharacterized protein LOC107610936 n=1 Tax=Arachis ipaensis TaxID=130454 RepID=UPI0007AF648D|nr:uncharacterized protein LOC107610936 [Arachis ipaensis]
MAGSSKTNRKEGNVPVEHECELQSFLDAASSKVVYQHVMMHVIPLVSFLFYLDWPERRFIDRCVEAGNADAILRQGLKEYFWIAHRGIGMELLSRAWTKGNVEVGYLSAMLLLCDHENEEEMQSGVKMLESVRTSGDVESCREFFADIFWERWVDERPSDPGDAVVCRSTTCTTHGTMACVNDVSRVSCVHCLADYEVRVFLEMFRF